MKFKIFGPFRVPQQENRHIAKDLFQFWETVDEKSKFAGLPDSCGCYVFALSPSGGGTSPWYVGKTNKAGFRKECFQHSKRSYYNDKIADYKRAKPLLFLIARQTPKGSLSSPTKHGWREIDKLEDMLIGIALQKNPELCNIHGTTLLKKMVVPGIINTPPNNPGKAVHELMDALGVGLL